MTWVLVDPDLERDEFAIEENRRYLESLFTPTGFRAPFGTRQVPSYGYGNPALQGVGTYAGYDADTGATEQGASADLHSIRPSAPDSGVVVEIEPSGTPDVDVPSVRFSLEGTDPADGNETLERWDMVVDDDGYKTVALAEIGGALKDFIWAAEQDGLYFESMRLTSTGDVGIGTDAPDEMLHVAGNILTDGDLILKSNEEFTGNMQADLLTAHRTWTWRDMDGTVAFLSDITGGASTLDDLTDVTITGVATGDYLRKSAGDWVNVTIAQLITDLDFDERAQDAVGGILTDSARIDFTYNDGGPTITADLIADTVSNTYLSNMAAWTTKIRNAGTTGDPSDAAAADITTEASPASGDFVWVWTDEGGGVFQIKKVAWDDLPGAVGFTDEEAQDAVGNILVDSATINFTYDDVTPEITAIVIDDSITFAKMQNIATDRLIGRDTAATGDPEEIALSADMEFTGSQAIRIVAFTGDVTKAAGGTALTIPNDTVTFAKMQNIATNSLIGRDTASTGDPENILLDDTLEMDGAGNLQRAALTGDITATAGSNTTAFRSFSAVSVLGRAANSAGVPTEIAAGANDRVLARTSDSVAFQQLTVGMAADDLWTFAKLQNIATDRLLGRDTAGSGDIEELTVGGGIEFTTGGGIQTSAFTGDVTKAAGGTATTIGSDKVLDTMLRDSAAVSVIGRSSNSSGDPADIAAGANDRVLRRSGDQLDFGQLTVGMAPDAVWTNAKLANMAAWTLKARNNSGSGVPQDVALADLAVEAAPAAGDFLLLFLADGSLAVTNWNELPGGGGTNALLDGSVHSDTVAQTVTRGSLIYGNSTPAWDELPIGSAGQFLYSNGTDVGWRTEVGQLAIKYYESLTKTNIGNAYVDIYTTGTAFHQTRLDRFDFANVTQVRIIWLWDYVGSGTQQVRWVDVADNTKVLYESSTFTADQDPGDSGWFACPANFTTLQAIEWQGKSTTAGDDPVAKGYAIYVR